MISLKMNFKRFADGSEWSEHKKQTNTIHFECERRDTERALSYIKQTYSSKITTVQAEKHLGYNWYFISMVGSSGSRLDPYILQV